VSARDVLGFLASLFLLALLAGAGASGCTKTTMERRAINAGVAEYRLDANFERQFYWKTNQPPAREVSTDTIQTVAEH
jgi:hypothetical protein